MRDDSGDDVSLAIEEVLVLVGGLMASAAVQLSQQLVDLSVRLAVETLPRVPLPHPRHEEVDNQSGDHKWAVNNVLDVDIHICRRLSVCESGIGREKALPRVGALKEKELPRIDISCILVHPATGELQKLLVRILDTSKGTAVESLTVRMPVVAGSMRRRSVEDVLVATAHGGNRRLRIGVQIRW